MPGVKPGQPRHQPAQRERSRRVHCQRA
ncbi:Permeases of the drug/metabolite transporter (DMT) superfamily [Caballeronia sordidicola]|uniref:Permeases of the drug/metabolite transporter (DMT) superfamily n=1 Tax=Caballeronia sordidicola TaxID=196367 RepID=A0A242N9M1_CABSO|nr:Permeases of the drug/metabolite transporter (DMT) superfamily [Caballeronia sordidicola]